MKAMKKIFILITLISFLSSCTITHDYYIERELKESSSVSMGENVGSSHYVSTLQGYLTNYLFLPVKMIDQTIATFSGVNPIYSKSNVDFQYSIFLLPFAWTIDVFETVFAGAHYGFLEEI